MFVRVFLRDDEGSIWIWVNMLFVCIYLFGLFFLRRIKIGIRVMNFI